MCSVSVSAASIPKARYTAAIFSASVMRKRRLPRAPSAGRSSKSSEKARRKSRGSRSAKSSFAVTILISRVENTLQ